MLGVTRNEKEAYTVLTYSSAFSVRAGVYLTSSQTCAALPQDLTLCDPPSCLESHGFVSTRYTCALRSYTNEGPSVQKSFLWCSCTCQGGLASTNRNHAIRTMAAYGQVLSGPTSGRRYVPVREPGPQWCSPRSGDCRSPVLAQGVLESRSIANCTIDACRCF